MHAGCSFLHVLYSIVCTLRLAGYIWAQGRHQDCGTIIAKLVALCSFKILSAQIQFFNNNILNLVIMYRYPDIHTSRYFYFFLPGKIVYRSPRCRPFADAGHNFEPFSESFPKMIKQATRHLLYYRFSNHCNLLQVFEVVNIVNSRYYFAGTLLRIFLIGFRSKFSVVCDRIFLLTYGCRFRTFCEWRSIHL